MMVLTMHHQTMVVIKDEYKTKREEGEGREMKPGYYFSKNSGNTDMVKLQVIYLALMRACVVCEAWNEYLVLKM